MSTDQKASFVWTKTEKRSILGVQSNNHARRTCLLTYDIFNPVGKCLIGPWQCYFAFATWVSKSNNRMLFTFLAICSLPTLSNFLRTPQHTNLPLKNRVVETASIKPQKNSPNLPNLPVEAVEFAGDPLRATDSNLAVLEPAVTSQAVVVQCVKTEPIPNKENLNACFAVFAENEQSQLCGFAFALKSSSNVQLVTSGTVAYALELLVASGVDRFWVMHLESGDCYTIEAWGLHPQFERSLRELGDLQRQTNALVEAIESDFAAKSQFDVIKEREKRRSALVAQYRQQQRKMQIVAASDCGWICLQHQLNKNVTRLQLSRADNYQGRVSIRYIKDPALNNRQSRTIESTVLGSFDIRTDYFNSALVIDSKNLPVRSTMTGLPILDASENVLGLIGSSYGDVSEKTSLVVPSRLIAGVSTQVKFSF